MHISVARNVIFLGVSLLHLSPGLISYKCFCEVVMPAAHAPQLADCLQAGVSSPMVVNPVGEVLGAEEALLILLFVCVLHLSCQGVVTQPALEGVGIPKFVLASSNTMANQCTAVVSLEDQIGPVLGFVGGAVSEPIRPILRSLL